MTNQSVLKDWVITLPFRMQSVLIAALRGYDQAKKDDHSKFITRSIRTIVLNNADPSNTFMTGEIPDAAISEQFLWDVDAYSMHFVMHTTHAIEIIGYKHPDKNIRDWYLAYYKKLVKAFHLNFETEDQLNIRLGGTQAEKEIKDKKAEEAINKIFKSRLKSPISLTKPKKDEEEKWDAGTGTSHGGRSRSYSGSS